jgi:glycosyltransferase involved in cell wall biosynthesis
MLTVIMPAYNEAKNIASMLSSIGDYKILVVDDGSTDSTADIVESLGYKAVRLENNCGKTRACIEGIRHSTSEFNIFIDADGQLNPKEIPLFVEALKTSDIVVGERSMTHIPLHRRTSNMFARTMIKRITNHSYNDVLCGFRAVRKSAFQKMSLKKGSYFLESEMLIEAHKLGLNVSTVPVSVSYETGSRMPIKESLKVATWLTKKAFIK